MEEEPTLVCNRVERSFVPGVMKVVLPSAVHCESDPPDVVYLPAELKVLDGPEYFRLQRTDRYLPGNASLSSRSETFLFLHRRLTAKPTIQASYLPFVAQQVINSNPMWEGDGTAYRGGEQSPLPLSGLFCEEDLTTAFLSPQAVPTDSSQFPDVSAAWDVRAVSIEGTVSPYEPYTRVLFHLQGQHWMSEQHTLPCVTLHVFHQAQAVYRTCHLQVGTY